MSFVIAVGTLLILTVASTTAFIQNRIVGGTDTNIFTCPYQVALYKNDLFACGGSIITKQCILTAAHCTHKATASNIRVRAGITKRSEKAGIILPASEIFINPSYDASTQNGDISIIKLNGNLDGEDMTPIPLATEEAPLGTTFRVTGWGKVHENRSISDNLQQTFVRSISKEKCINEPYDYRDDEIQSGMFCGDNPSKVTDSCAGDSGGPVVANGKQYAVVSWGIGCGRPKYPGVYGKIVPYMPWINSIVEEHCYP